MAKRKRKRNPGKAKGSAFEREISKRLSLWWTRGESSQVFWRSSGFISRAGDRKEHQFGDIHAIDYRGKWLVEHVNIELKNYKELNLLELVDKPDKSGVLILKHWDQCLKDAEASDREPLLIEKRNFGEPFVVCRVDLADWLAAEKDRIEFNNGTEQLCAFSLAKMEETDPEEFMTIFTRLGVERTLAKSS